MSSSSPEPKAKPTGAMALLEKYSALNRGMEDARRENAEYKSKLEAAQQQIENLQNQRQEMLNETEQAQRDTTQLHQDVQEALTKYGELEKKHAGALLEKMDAQRNFESTQQFVEQERQNFLQDSRDFRTSCKRMKLDASAVGEDMATIVAFLECHEQIFCSNGDDSQQEDDDEIEQMAEECRRHEDARYAAARALRIVQTKNKDSMQKSTSRTERKRQLLAQLDRVQKDNTDLEEQLKSIDQNTREFRDMAHNYEKGLARRRDKLRRLEEQSIAASQNSVTPSPYARPQSQNSTGGTRGAHLRNPYARQSNASNGRTNSSGPTSGSFTRGYSSVEQHPHLARRIRKDRQFGTALEIMSGRTGTQEEYVPRFEEQNREQASRTSQSDAMSLLDNDDSDDDDDDILSFVAFPKK